MEYKAHLGGRACFVLFCPWKTFRLQIPSEGKWMKLLPKPNGLCNSEIAPEWPQQHLQVHLPAGAQQRNRQVIAAELTTGSKISLGWGLSAADQQLRL